jgi:hypothetical protein
MTVSNFVEDMVQYVLSGNKRKIIIGLEGIRGASEAVLRYIADCIQQRQGTPPLSGNIPFPTEQPKRAEKILTAALIILWGNREPLISVQKELKSFSGAEIDALAEVLTQQYDVILDQYFILSGAVEMRR